MSTLVFRMRIGDHPSEQEDLLQMRLIRYFAAAVTGTDPEKLCTGLRSGAQRDIWCSVHAPVIPRKWIEDAQLLVHQQVFVALEWSGDVEEIQRDNRHDLERVLQSFMDFTRNPFIAGTTHTEINLYAAALCEKAQALLSKENY